MGDMSKYEPKLQHVDISQCEPPTNYDGARLAASVVILLYASGSMAGKLGKQSKMSIPKNGVSSFLNDLGNGLHVGLITYGHKGTNKMTARQSLVLG